MDLVDPELAPRSPPPPAGCRRSASRSASIPSRFSSAIDRRRLGRTVSATASDARAPPRGRRRASPSCPRRAAGSRSPTASGGDRSAELGEEAFVADRAARRPSTRRHDALARHGAELVASARASPRSAAPARSPAPAGARRGAPRWRPGAAARLVQSGVERRRRRSARGRPSVRVPVLSKATIRIAPGVLEVGAALEEDAVAGGVGERERVEAGVEMTSAHGEATTSSVIAR